MPFMLSDVPPTSEGTARPMNSELSPEMEELLDRLLASAVGLPRICVFKVCRRRKRCFGAGPACLEHHRGLVRKRMKAAIALLSGQR